MAVKLTTQLLDNGPRNLAFNFTGQGDGQGQLNLVKVVDNSLYNPGKFSRVDKITSDIGYGIVTLFWDGATPQPFATLGGIGQTFDYKPNGGMNPPATLEGVNGNVLMSTTGFEVGSSFTIKLDMVK